MIRKLIATASLVFLILILAFDVPAPAAAASKPNLILITLDSARADRMGFLGAKGALTPNLNHLAVESIVFEHAYAQAPGTVVSHASILTGAYPQSTGLSEIGGALPSSLPFLPDLLKAQGYRTAAFVGSIELDPRNGLAQGFDRGFQTYDAGFRPIVPGDIHSPLTERSASEVAADHGQSLGAHGEDSHGIFLYDETIHVPLLVRMPEAQPSARQVTAKVRLVDIAPTLLEIAGIPVPSQMQGQSLLRIARSGGGGDQPVYSRRDLSQRGFGHR